MVHGPHRHGWKAGGHKLTAPAGADLPGTGSAGDIFLQSRFPLHSGRIIGLPGRVLMSLMGVVIATLSVTGVLIWARKRRSRAHAAGRAPQALPSGALGSTSSS